VDILFATSNPHKAQQVQELLGRPVQQVDVAVPEIQALQVQAVIEPKARAAYEQVGKPVLVEDTSLSIHAWYGLPGALVRWFLETVGNDGICKMLEGYEQLDAIAETCIGYFDGGSFVAFSGVVEGRIARHPRGQRGFGWNPIFIPNGWDKTYAEMTPEEGASVSMRKIAVLKLRAYLDANGL
jgi:non-canonical purine NTP pyrophosphatase (RdgB/HAM1 family)